MTRICRTCTQVINNNDYFYLNGCSYASADLQVQHLLQNCIPEFDFELVPDSVMCKNCVSSLHVAFYFRQEAIKNEQIFRSKQLIRIRNFEDLTKNSMADENEINMELHEDLKVQAFEVELADANDLKTEYVYDDVDELDEVECLVENERVFEDTSELANDDRDSKEVVLLETPCVNDESPGSSAEVPFDDRFQLLDDISCDVNLDVGDNTFQILEASEISVEHESGDDFNFKGVTTETEEKLPDMSVQCDKSHTDLKSITSYIQCTSCSSRKIRNVRRPYKCSECNYQSDAQASLIVHKRIHTGEKPYHCSVCSYKAKRKAHLDDHMKIHTGERPYRCNICGKTFINKQIMKNHTRIHTGEKPYRCLKCNYQSRHKASIANHLKKVHIGLDKMIDTEPSVCYICGKCLSGPSSLSTHMRIHTGMKSHLCELCGRYFREKAMLRNHLLTHTGEKPFQCTLCDYIATRKAHLQDHLKTHVGVTELARCTECGKRYASKLLLKKHMRVEHNNFD